MDAVRGGLRRLVPALALVVVLALPVTAEAAITSIPNGAGGSIPCTTQTNGQRHCSGIFTTFDGAPIDVNVAFPPQPASGPDGDFPIVGVFHGWGGSKLSPTTGGWVRDGYAFFSMSDRGWGNSCGALDPKRLQPVCANGYNHLMDTRFEVRDAQEVFEALADAPAQGGSGEGLINPRKIGATGGSYGGGISMALAALRDRKMIEANDGTLVPWVSDGGKQMEIAAAQPDIPWTDLAYSLQPNGHTLDYVADAPYMKRGRIGVLKQSFVAGLYALGQALSNYAPAGTDPDADLTTWYTRVNAGEPYDQDPLASDVVDEITKHHSSYYIDNSTPPAPLLISNGWTDDLFPPDEAIRFYNKTRDAHPDTPVSMIFTDHGHQRGQNKGPDAAFRSRELHHWFDYYVKGVGSEPYQGVQTLTQTCDGPSGGATGAFDDPSSDEPFRASSWARLAPGEIRMVGLGSQTIAPEVADRAGTTFDPIGGGGACATAPSDDQPGAASYRLDHNTADGFTLMGSPTVIADIHSPGPTSQIAARLLDVELGTGEERLVARGLYRPEINLGTEGTRQVFQLHPNGWKFDGSSHVVKLELLPADQPYGRNSNGQAAITVSNVELRLPVLETPGALDGLVEQPAPKVVPPGYELASDYRFDGFPRPRGASNFRVPLAVAYEACTTPNRTHGSGLSGSSCSPAGQESDELTVGTPEANGEDPRFAGSIRLTPRLGTPGNSTDEADVRLEAALTDVRRKGDLSDYDGDLLAQAALRITDKGSGSSEREAATVTDVTLEFTVPCAATPESAAGGDCFADTTADALVPGTVVEERRSNWELGQLRVFDAGADADVGTAADNAVFARQGVFVP